MHVLVMSHIQPRMKVFRETRGSAARGLLFLGISILAGRRLTKSPVAKL